VTIRTLGGQLDGGLVEIVENERLKRPTVDVAGER
jgi:hypothetical protein